MRKNELKTEGLSLASSVWLVGLLLIGFGYCTKSETEDLFMGVKNFVWPISLVVAGNRVIVMLGLALALLAGLFGGGGRKVVFNASWSIGALFVLHFLLAVRKLFAGLPLVETVLEFVLVGSLITAICAIPDQLGRSYHLLWRSLLRLLVVLAILVLIVNLYQYLVDSSAIVHRGRLFGVSTHPNEFGICCAFLSSALFHLLLKDRNVVVRMLILVLFLAAVLGVFGSGSRTAFLAAIFGVGALLYGQISSRAFSGGILALIVLLFTFVSIAGLVSSPTDSLNFARSVSLENTRSDTMLGMFFALRDNFWLGNPLDTQGTSNSFLYAGASLGFTGVLFSLFVFGFSGTAIWRTISGPRVDPWIRSASYCMMGMWICLFVSAFLSGYLIESIQPGLFFLLLTCICVRRFEIAIEFDRRIQAAKRKLLSRQFR